MRTSDAREEAEIPSPADKKLEELSVGGTYHACLQVICEDRALKEYVNVRKPV